MGQHKIIDVVSWIAVVLFSVSYWFQIRKIHIHKEVRDISMTYHTLLAVGSIVLAYTAWVEDSTIFVVKQVMTAIPVMVIISQIIIHKEDHWYDVKLALCSYCGERLEISWNHCPCCGEEKNRNQKKVQEKHHNTNTS